MCIPPTIEGGEIGDIVAMYGRSFLHFLFGSVAIALGSYIYFTMQIDMSNGDYKNAASIYEFTVKDTHGNDVSLDKYKGQVVLVVNIASKCGLTKNNYQKLTDLKEKYGDKGLVILNFPCNQFGSQMPEADGEAMVCHLRDSKADIGEVFAKVDVNGDNAAPLYKYLKAKQTGTLGSGIKWNFTKFLVNKEGIPVNRYAPTTDPMDIAKDIEKLL
ncbi:uncharacterized protein Dana_GF10532, isoform B [Drosophila ananassae]|uniref:Glutathione peroxidase n=2 Tax=Drosophila ananassae TaxID=7217 RepID=A0A0P8YAW8_DROAN|nr:probable phospholipid hydroperoxide glutathione peroxidase isoform X2 [Drosophila ananassae]KPU78583.1 uncharacterized protein Dana_GF10532, isoform B [Drosophila ananassae]